MQTFWRLSIWLSRIPLLAFCLFLAWLGARWLIDPRAVAAGNGVVIDPASAPAITNMRGSGAVFVGSAVVVGACLVSASRVLLGLRFATTLIASSFVVCLSILALAGTTPLLLRIVGTEAVLLIAMGSGLILETLRRRRERREPGTAPGSEIRAPLEA